MATHVLVGIRDYIRKLRFRRNAWLYLLSAVITGIAFGIFRLLFNFYVISFGYDEALIGRLVAVSSLAAIGGALPAGYLCDRLGRKLSLLLGSGALAASVLGMVLWHNPLGFYLMSTLSGLAQALTAVTSGPFLMENSGVELGMVCQPAPERLVAGAVRLCSRLSGYYQYLRHRYRHDVAVLLARAPGGAARRRACQRRGNELILSQPGLR